MFSGCENMNVFVGTDLQSLVNGRGMFTNCQSLTSFTDNLSSLMDGSGMFSDCFSLTDFNSNLSCLKSGAGMFEGCPLSVESVKNISETISDISSVDFETDDEWKYTIMGEEFVIDPENRGKITFMFPDDKIADEEYIKSVSPILTDIQKKNWKIERNLPFYYDKSFSIQVQIKNSSKWDTELFGFLNFNFIRNINETASPNVRLLGLDGETESPYNKNVEHVIATEFTPSNDNDDGSGQGRYILRATQILSGHILSFFIIGDGTDLSLRLQVYSDEVRVYIDGVLQEAE